MVKEEVFVEEREIERERENDLNDFALGVD